MGHFDILPQLYFYVLVSKLVTKAYESVCLVVNLLLISNNKTHAYGMSYSYITSLTFQWKQY